jgi:hypothetical protein
MTIWTTQQLVAECDTLRSALEIIDRTFAQLAALPPEDSTDRAGIDQMRQWAQASLTALEGIRPGLSMGVSDTEPYADFLVNLQADILEVRDRFALESHRLQGDA